jgi:hypothetical protein
MSDFHGISDESVRRLYESIREQAAMDVGNRHRFMGEAAKKQAQRLRDEMTCRRLVFTPIDWVGL